MNNHEPTLDELAELLDELADEYPHDIDTRTPYGRGFQAGVRYAANVARNRATLEA